MTVHVARSRLSEVLGSARSIYISACAAEIEQAPALFRQHLQPDATLTGLFTPLANRVSYVDPEIGLKVRSFFLTNGLKKHLSTGLVEYCPWRYAMIDQYLSKPGRFDTALVMLSPPDAMGRCSFGVQADFLPSFYRGIERIIGFINPHMPQTFGHDTIDFGALTCVVDYDVPLKSVAQKVADADAEVIAARIAALVPDGAVVQNGIGQIPSQVIARLSNHRRLAIHTGVIDDGIMSLEDAGALDRDQPIVTGTAVATKPLYDALSGNYRFAFRPVSFTHSFRQIAGRDRFIAINSVLQVDLFGQMSAEGSAGKLVASPGGLPDFTRAALHSPGGKSIIALRARAMDGRARGIVPLLDRPHTATCPAGDADIIVTEFGAADVRELTLDQRAEAIIAIADPISQHDLAEAWRAIRQSITAR